ncbi:hypothetical protein D9X30_4775 [Cupriavidus sp. U2]|nr:hypothetical protein D9X30_4775 [Cupriavidus sp. U2]
MGSRGQLCKKTEGVECFELRCGCGGTGDGLLTDFLSILTEPDSIPSANYGQPGLNRSAQPPDSSVSRQFPSGFSLRL